MISVPGCGVNPLWGEGRESVPPSTRIDSVWDLLALSSRHTYGDYGDADTGGLPVLSVGVTEEHPTVHVAAQTETNLQAEPGPSWSPWYRLT